MVFSLKYSSCCNSICRADRGYHTCVCVYTLSALCLSLDHNMHLLSTLHLHSYTHTSIPVSTVGHLLLACTPPPPPHTHVYTGWHCRTFAPYTHPTHTPRLYRQGTVGHPLHARPPPLHTQVYTGREALSKLLKREGRAG